MITIWFWNNNRAIKENNNQCKDVGCDIIAENIDETIVCIQCKNYSTTGVDNVINISDLAGFYNFIAENVISTGIVYYSGKLSQQIIRFFYCCVYAMVSPTGWCL